MEGTASDFITWLKEKNLYNIFYAIAKSSMNDSLDYCHPTTLTIKEAHRFASNAAPELCDNIIQSKIYMLFYCGIIVVDGMEAPIAHNIKYKHNDGILDENHDKFVFKCEQDKVLNDETKMRLSNDSEADISGSYIYNEIISDERSQAAAKSLNDAFKPIESNYRDYVDKSKLELERKITSIENSTLKSIEIISIFTAVITLILSNAIGALNISKYGIKTYFAINLAVVLSVFFLLLFTRLLIKENSNKKSLLIAFAIIIVFVISMVILITII